MFSKNYLKAIGHALAGIVLFFRTEANAKLHLLASAIAIGISLFVGIDASEWLWIALAISLVLVSEMLNTAIEGLCDKITTDQDPKIKVIKDISAGAVLLASGFALVVAAIIFIPKLF